MTGFFKGTRENILHIFGAIAQRQPSGFGRLRNNSLLLFSLNLYLKTDLATNLVLFSVKDPKQNTYMKICA